MERFISFINVFDYFHYPKHISREYKESRQNITNKYGDITIIILVLFLISIPILKFLIIRGYTITSKLQIFKRINVGLNRLIQRDDDERTVGFKSSVANNLKTFIFKIYFHSTSILLIAFWVILLSFLSLNESIEGDLIVIAKRLGKVATVSLPTVLFLSLRPSPLPNTLYLALLPIHKWLSRIIILQCILHTIIYCGFFNLNNTWKKALKHQNLYGWAALFGFFMIFITSILSFRHRYYKIFYFQHYTWSWIVVITIQLHARPVKVTPYTIANILILVAQVIYRLRLTRVASRKTDIKVTNVSSHLALVEFPNEKLTNKPTSPGAHIRIAEYNSSWIVRGYRQFIPNYHPYTLVSLPLDNYQKLIVGRGNFKIQNDHKYLVCGSYDPNLLFLKSKNNSNKFSISKLRVSAKRVLIVIGGSAISFALPILRVMNYHGIPTKIIWVVKDFRDIAILKFFDGFVHGDDFEIFVTGGSELNHDPNIKKYGSIGGLLNVTHANDLENEQQPLLGEQDNESLLDDDKYENVEISVDVEEEEEEDDECAADCTRDNLIDDLHEIRTELDNHSLDEDANVLGNPQQEPRERSRKPSIALSRKTSISTTNEIFTPTLNTNSSDESRHYLHQFTELIKNLNIDHRIYKGRPKINYKYYNWCINEGFTQCSGPVEDSSNNLICCRDLVKGKGSTVDSSNIWVISAGPTSLVKNVKLWATENGFNFHEELFYV